MKSKFKLTFYTDLGKHLYININRANPDIEIAEIKKIMDGIIATKAVQSQSSGSPVKKVRAELENVKIDYIEFEE